jgi:hypothetical protein
MFNPTLLRKITIMNTRAALATLNYMRGKFSLRMRLEEGLKAPSPELIQTSSIRQQQSSAMSLEVIADDPLAVQILKLQELVHIRA